VTKKIRISRPRKAPAGLSNPAECGGFDNPPRAFQVLRIDDLNRLEEQEEERDAAMLAQAIATETEFYSVEQVETELARLESAG